MTNITYPLSLEGRKYLVTGAAAGIGKATCKLLADLGASLILVDINENGLRETERELLSTNHMGGGGNHMVLPMDLSETESIKNIVEQAVGRFGKINGIAHVAGLPYMVPLKHVDSVRAEKLYKVNQYAAVELTKVFASQKVYAGEYGSVVYVSSYCGQVGLAASVAYSMTKAAVIGISKALAIELAPRKIRVNCVAPGTIKTDMLNSVNNFFGEGHLELIESLHPLGLGDSSDIANGIAFLLSDMSKWITGITLNIDGGFTAR